MRFSLAVRQYGALAIALIAAFNMAWTWRHFVVDDTYIPFRYAAHWLSGNGLVWNAGERVEGYTSFLHVVMLTALHGVGIDFIIASRSVNGLAFIALLIMFWRAFFRPINHLCVIMLLTCVPMIAWVIGGLETILFTALLTASVMGLLSLLEGEKIKPWHCGLLFALATLARPEALLFAWLGMFSMTVAGCKKQLAWRAIAEAAVPYIVIIGAHLLWRHSYYDSWLPNTYYAKLGGTVTGDHLLRGLHYVWSFCTEPPFLPFYTLCCVVAMMRVKKNLLGNGLLLTMIGSYIAYVIYAGGDWMTEARFMVPLIPLLIMLMARLAAPYAEAIRRHKHGYCIAYIVLALGLLQCSRTQLEATPAFPVYLQHIAQHIQQNWPPGSLVAINMAGLIPSETMGVNYLDMLGLNDRHIARAKVPFTALKDGMPGHYKGDGAYVSARKPDYIIPGDAISNGDMIHHPIYVTEQQLAADPTFLDHYTAKHVEIPLHTSRFSNNVITFYYYERN